MLILVPRLSRDSLALVILARSLARRGLCNTADEHRAGQVKLILRNRGSARHKQSPLQRRLLFVCRINNRALINGSLRGEAGESYAARVTARIHLLVWR